MLQRLVYRLKPVSGSSQAFGSLAGLVAARGAKQKDLTDFTNACFASRVGFFSDSIDAGVDIPSFSSFWIADAIVIEATPERHRLFKSHADVLFTHPDYEYQLPNFVLERSQERLDSVLLWNLQQLNILNFRESTGTTGAGVSIGVVDTGADGSHSELSGKIAAFATVPKNGPLSETGGAVEPVGLYHGTHVCGLLVSQRFGVCPAAKLVVASAMNGLNGASTWTQIVSAIQWVITKNVAAINLSIEGAGGNELDEVFESCLRLGIGLFAAIGNVPHGTATYPGKSPLTVSVGATTMDGKLRLLSGSGLGLPVVVAPGEAIVSTLPGNSQGSLSGTSQAAPHVTGLFALLKEAFPNVSSNQFIGAIRDSAEPLPSVSPDDQGRGQVSFRKCYDRLTDLPSGGVIPASSSVSNTFSQIESVVIALARAVIMIECDSGNSEVLMECDSFLDGLPVPVAPLRFHAAGGALMVSEDPSNGLREYTLRVTSPVLRLLRVEVVTGSVECIGEIAAADIRSRSAGIKAKPGSGEFPQASWFLSTDSGAVEVTRHETQSFAISFRTLTGNVSSTESGVTTALAGIGSLRPPTPSGQINITTVSGEIHIVNE